jgi:hypothetical protein
VTETSDGDSTTTPSDTESVGDIIFEMEDMLNEGLCLADTLISLVEGRRTLRVKPGTIYFLAFELQKRFEQIHADWQRLFKLSARG